MSNSAGYKWVHSIYVYYVFGEEDTEKTDLNHIHALYVHLDIFNDSRYYLNKLHVPVLLYLTIMCCTV